MTELEKTIQKRNEAINPNNIIKLLNKRRMCPCGYCTDNGCRITTSDCLDDDFVINEAIEAIKFREWYREQDLIKREDVVELLVQHIMLDDDIDEEQARFIAENEYRRVPKAEPIKE